MCLQHGEAACEDGLRPGTVRMASSQAHLSLYCNIICGQGQHAVGREDELTPPSISLFSRHPRFS